MVGGQHGFESPLLPFRSLSIFSDTTMLQFTRLHNCDLAIDGDKVANLYGFSVRITEFDLFHSLTAVGPKSYGYKIILRV